MMDEGGVEVDGKSDEAMLKVICETDAGGMNHVIRVVPSDVLSSALLLKFDCPQSTSSKSSSDVPEESSKGSLSGRIGFPSRE